MNPSDPLAISVWLGDTVLDLAALRVRRPGREDVALTPLEARVVRRLALARGATVPRADLLQTVWAYHPAVESRAVDKLVYRLRAKIDVPSGPPRHLRLTRGLGYRLDGARVLDAGCTPPGGLFGRHAEIDALDAAYAGGAGWISVSGAAGIGKSRLIAAWTDGRAPLWRVSARDVAGEEGVEARVARAAGAHHSANGSWLAARVEDGVVDAAILVVEDVGFDPSGLAALVGRWREAAPRLLVVTTSLGPQPGADLDLRLGPLGRPAAVAMLAAGAAGQGAAASVGDPGALDALADAVGGHPLCLEVLGGALTALTPREVIDRMGTNLQLGSVTASGRARLSAAIEVARAGLSPSDQRTLEVSAAFLGTFQVVDLEEAAGLPVGVVVDAAHELTRRGLWTRVAPGRFAAAPVVRAALGDALTATERERIADVRVTAVLRRVGAVSSSGWFGPESRDVVDLLELEMNEVASAMSWCVANGAAARAARCLRVYRARAEQTGDASEGRAWAQPVLALHLEPADRANALLDVSILHRLGGQLVEADAAAHACADLASDLGLIGVEVLALGSLATTSIAAGRLDDGLAASRTAVALHEARGEAWWAAVRWGTAGTALRLMGRYREARVAFDACLAGLSALGDERTLAMMQLNDANLRVAVGEYEIAAELFRGCLPVFERTHDRRTLCKALVAKLEGEIGAGSLDEAEDTLERARAAIAETGDPLRASLWADEVALRLARGRRDDALTLAEESLTRLRPRDRVVRVYLGLTLAQARLDAGQIAAASRALTAIEADLPGLEAGPLRPWWSVVQALRAAADGDLRTARAWVRRARLHAESMGIGPDAAIARQIEAVRRHLVDRAA